MVRRSGRVTMGAPVLQKDESSPSLPLPSHITTVILHAHTVPDEIQASLVQAVKKERSEVSLFFAVGRVSVSLTC